MTEKEAIKIYCTNEKKAMKQGWLICLDTDTGYDEIMKYDEDPNTKLISDCEAVEFVLRRASQCKLARAAVKICYGI